MLEKDPTGIERRAADRRHGAEQILYHIPFNCNQEMFSSKRPTSHYDWDCEKSVIEMVIALGMAAVLVEMMAFWERYVESRRIVLAEA